MLKFETMILPPIWLASASPRRQEMLAWLGLSFKIQSVDIDERGKKDEPADVYVKRLADEKATAASLKAKAVDTQVFILAADTTVVLGNKILGKPMDDMEAILMLKDLRDKKHQVITSLLLLNTAQNLKTNENCITNVQMRNYSDKDIREYVDSGDPFDKAGGYAIQNPRFHPVINFCGCFASVMGMPLCHLERNLRKYQDYSPQPVNEICRNFLDYTCPIHQRVLNGENIG
jgi:septum formation protein